MNDYGIGNIKRSAPSVLAEKAGKYISSFQPGHLSAVTIDLRGRVAIEPVSTSAEVDMIGVYSSKGSWQKIARLVEADLAEEAKRFS